MVLITVVSYHIDFVCQHSYIYDAARLAHCIVVCGYHIAGQETQLIPGMIRHTATENSNTISLCIPHLCSVCSVLQFMVRRRLSNCYNGNLGLRTRKYIAHRRYILTLGSVICSHAKINIPHLEITYHIVTTIHFHILFIGQKWPLPGWVLRCQLPKTMLTQQDYTVKVSPSTSLYMAKRVRHFSK